MTLYQYKVLSEREQYETLWDKGEFLTFRIQDQYKLALYQIEGFYVEVKYDYEDNKIISQRSFSSINELEPYLSSISIADITK